MKTYAKYLLLPLYGLVFVPACFSPHAQDNGFCSDRVHSAHLAGNWYSAEKNELARELEQYFVFARENFSLKVDPQSIKALIVPHAGYYYSGICAASVYQLLRDASGNKNSFFNKVIILAPSHIHAFSGVALPDYEVYRTTFGDIMVDRPAIEALKQLEQFKVIAQAHAPEHSIEIQLPFLQMVLKKFTLVPLVVGNVAEKDFDTIATTLASIVDEKTLVVVSSDFMHFGASYGYQPFTKDIFYHIRYYDSLAIQAIESLSSKNFQDVLNKTQNTICGRMPILFLLSLIDKGILGKNLQSRLASYYSSAQLIQARRGDEKNMDVRPLFEAILDAQLHTCVSYVGLIFTQELRKQLSPINQLTMYEKKSLIHFARDVIANTFELREHREEALLSPILTSGLQQSYATFVTLKKQSGDLRGCIGSIMTSQPIVVNVALNAKQAAFGDPRFMPLTRDELSTVSLDITVLTPPYRVAGYKDIVIGKHGIILKKGQVQAVFLPQVPSEFGWTKEETLAHLCAKGGLDRDDWKNDCEFNVFEGFQITE